MDDIIWMYEVCLEVMSLILFLTAWCLQLLKCHFNLWSPPNVPSWGYDGVGSTAVAITATDNTSIRSSTDLTAAVTGSCGCDSRNSWCLKQKHHETEAFFPILPLHFHYYIRHQCIQPQKISKLRKSLVTNCTTGKQGG
jgi:hypothetical protein